MSLARSTEPLPRGAVKRHADSRQRMLEDPTYSQVVRWGDEGDSFVVLEVGTKTMMVGHRNDLTSLLE